MFITLLKNPSVRFLMRGCGIREKSFAEWKDIKVGANNVSHQSGTQFASDNQLNLSIS